MVDSHLSSVLVRPEKSRQVINTLTPMKTTHKRKQNNPTVGARYGEDISFVKKVMRSTCFIKNGVGTCTDITQHIARFSGQSAKVVKFSDYSFPTFVIRRMDQRNSYSKGYEGVKSSLKIPTEAPL